DGDCPEIRGLVRRRLGPRERSVVEVVAPDVPGGFVEVPELIARQVRRPFRDKGKLHGSRVLSLPFHIRLLDGDAVQPGVLDRHADWSCDGGEQSEVVLVETTVLILGVDLEDPHRIPRAIPEGYADQRADTSFLDARAVAETRIGADVLAQEGSTLARHEVED